MLIDIFKVFILSLVEAFTEFLPISSTGHMIIIEKIINLSSNKTFVTSFQIIIQLGAILAVIVIFFQKIFPFNKNEKEKKQLYNLWFKILISVIPSIIFGLLFDDIIEYYLFNEYVVAIMLIIYGIILFLIESINKKAKITSLNDITYKTAFFIGMFQVLAMIPGTSRSAATIIGAMLLGLNRFIATEFSFFLAIPTMLGATSLKLVKNINNLSVYELFLIFLGLFLTFIFSLKVINSFLKYIKNNNFKIFSYYRIILGIIILIYALLGAKI